MDDLFIFGMVLAVADQAWTQRKCMKGGSHQLPQEKGPPETRGRCKRTPAYRPENYCFN